MLWPLSPAGLAPQMLCFRSAPPTTCITPPAVSFTLYWLFFRRFGLVLFLLKLWKLYCHYLINSSSRRTFLAHAHTSLTYKRTLTLSSTLTLSISLRLPISQLLIYLSHSFTHLRTRCRRKHRNRQTLHIHLPYKHTHLYSLLRHPFVYVCCTRLPPPNLLP